MNFSTRAATAGLTALAGIHLLWASGSSWPLEDRDSLADAVIGRAGGGVPPPAACIAVAVALTSSAGLVSGRPRGAPGLRRIGVSGVVVTLATRAGFGLAGRTNLLSPGSLSPRFRRLDRRFYSPLCLTLAVLALPALRRPGTRA